MIAHHTNGNIMTVKKLLRHKRVGNAMKYIQIIHFDDKDFEVAMLQCLRGKAVRNRRLDKIR